MAPRIRDAKANAGRRPGGEHAAGIAGRRRSRGSAPDRQGAEARVDSRDTDKLPIEARRLDLGAPYPVTIAPGDAPALRKRMSAAMARVGRKPDAKGGGNQNKRVRLVIADATLGDRELAEGLAKGK